MLTAVDVPDVGCIQFHPITPFDNTCVVSKQSQEQQQQKHQHPQFPLGAMPVKFQLDDIETKFVDVRILPL